MKTPALFYASVLFLFAGNAIAAPTVQDFQSSQQTDYVLTKHGGGPAAVLENGDMKLLYTTGQLNSLGFDRTAEGMYGKITAQWDFSILAGADGFGFILLNTADYGTSGACPAVAGEEPTLAGSFAVGFDVYCKDYSGNLGEHEVSLHWDGMERANRFSEFDFRGGQMRRAVLEVDYVVGGAEITLSLDGNYVYDHFFMEEMTPYESRVAVIGRTGGVSTVLYLDNLNVTFEEPCQAAEVPTEVTVFDAEQMWPGQGWAYRTVALPDDGTIYERVIMEVSLNQPPEGWDPWDRIMAIYATDDNGTRFEVARYITPYSKEWTWWMDVTDFQSILKGSRPFSLWLQHWAWNTGGFLVTANTTTLQKLKRFRRPVDNSF